MSEEASTEADGAGTGARRRRIDRVTSPDFLEDLEQRPVSDIRAMRDECRDEELRLSYARRLVQGRIDIVRAEIERRGRGDDEPLDLVALLPKILADDPAPQARDPRNVALFSPEGPTGQRAHDAVLEDPIISHIPDLDDDELRGVLADLEASERDVSATRRTVLDHFDRLQGELIARYRDGAADVDEIVSSVAGEHRAP